MSYLRRRHHTSGVRTPRPKAGDAAETAACGQLQQAGCRILARNVRYREGEIDIVAVDGRTLVFVELRICSRDDLGGTDGSVDCSRQRRLLRAAQLFLQQRYDDHVPPCRFDVMTADESGIRDWIRSAFGAE